jgi:hypothetical protein
MSNSTLSHNDVAAAGSEGVQAPARRLTTETKSAFKTTELVVYIVSVVGVLVASAVVDTNEDGQGFGARQAWLYITLLTIGYLVSRGLAKSGSRERYDA